MHVSGAALEEVREVGDVDGTAQKNGGDGRTVLEVAGPRVTRTYCFSGTGEHWHSRTAGDGDRRRPGLGDQRRLDLRDGKRVNLEVGVLGRWWGKPTS